MFLNQVIVVLLELDTLLTCILFNDQIRMGPSYAVPASKLTFHCVLVCLTNL